jgi:hypothetical protein
LKFPEVFPYEGFKAAVWGDVQGRSTPSGPDPAALPQSQATPEAAALGISSGDELEDERIRPPLEDETAWPDTRGQGTIPEDLASWQPPSLVEVRRKHMRLYDRAAALPWLATSLLGLLAAVLLAILARIQVEHLRKLGGILGGHG